MDTNPDYIDHNQLSVLVIEFRNELHHVVVSRWARIVKSILRQ